MKCIWYNRHWLLTSTTGFLVCFATTFALKGSLGLADILIDEQLSAMGSNTTLSPFHDVTDSSNNSIPAIIRQPACQWILYDDIGISKVRIWDLLILLPNTFFLMYLLLKLKTAVAKLKNTSSPIFTAFYGLVLVVAAISVLRCVVSMTVNATAQAGKITDKLLWLILRFFLLGTELSVVIFGLAFGHLESHASIRRVLFVTAFIALAYSSTQGILEFLYPDPSFHVSGSLFTNETSEDYDIFGHGGMIFWLTSSLFFTLVYTVIFVLPWTTLKDVLQLPSRKTFYYYAAFLAVLNCLQSIGSGLLIGMEPTGMCVVDVTTFLYFTCFDPLVYSTFLWEFFRTTPSILFSYKHQVDDPAPDNDSVHLPYASSLKGDEDGSIDGSYDSTHFDKQFSNVSNGVLTINAEPDHYSYNTDYYQESV